MAFIQLIVTEIKAIFINETLRKKQKQIIH